MWKLPIAVLLLAPAFAMADECRFEAPLGQSLDLAGVHTLEIRLGRHNLHLTGSEGTTARMAGRACASSKERLDKLHLAQHREGDRLVLVAEDDDSDWSFNLFGWSNYAYLDMQLDIPRNLAVDLAVGSGDADVAGIDNLDSHVGSGDLHARNIGGRFTTSVGSGDIVAHDTGAIRVDSIGSGDFTADTVRGDVAIGSIGSGDAGLKNVEGNVVVDSIGSGDLNADGITRDLRVRTVGSGDVTHHHISGRVDIPSDD
jgi:DUF4097 and DUF4098 domain-containing protein YvlB